MNSLTRIAVWQGRFSHSPKEVTKIVADDDTARVDFVLKRGEGYDDTIGSVFIHEQDLIASLEMLRKERSNGGDI